MKAKPTLEIELHCRERDRPWQVKIIYEGLFLV